MAHTLKAVIGRTPDATELGSRWVLARLIALPQGMAMIPLTARLLDDMEKLVSSARHPRGEKSGLLPAALSSVLEKVTQDCSLGYIETDYFGGVGSQTAALWRNGRLVLGPLLRETHWDAESGQHIDSGPAAINDVLVQLGVKRGRSVDEFDALGLSKYRSVG
jgi:hypothetical protein